MKAEVETVLNQVRPGLEAHGGGVQIVDIDPVLGVLTVSLQGACVGCPLSSLTLKGGIESVVLENIPEIKTVVNREESIHNLDEGSSELVS
ncbi:MAG: NifU family protein [bacterium]|nr:NifU family protein [bacterium]